MYHNACLIYAAIGDPKYVLPFGGPKNPRTVPPPPPIVTMSISMKTVVNPTSHVHEIVALSALVHTAVEAEKKSEVNPKLCKRFTFVRQLGTSSGNSYPAQFPHNIATEAKKTGKFVCICMFVRIFTYLNIHSYIGFMQTFPNERALLSVFFARMLQEVQHTFNIIIYHVIFNIIHDIKKYTQDPDVLTSHNLYGFEFDVILSRTVANKLPLWSR